MYNASSTDRIEIVGPTNVTSMNEFRRDILKGLTASQKFIPSKYFYDACGSNLFEKICLLPEYYLTRMELSILKDSASAIMENFQGGDLIELGSGASWKVKTLLNVAYQSSLIDIRYIPIDVNELVLKEASKELLSEYPHLKVLGIVADFTKKIEKIPTEREKLFILFGSTIGNFHEKEAITFLRNIAQLMEPNDRFLLGLDMVKPREVLEPAYNDTQGVTSEFNKNILSVVNRKLDANFHLDHFDHYAFFDSEKSQMEMHLRANCKIAAEIKGLNLHITMEKGETIRTEISRKFTIRRAEAMIAEAGFVIKRWFFDPNQWFSLIELTRSTSDLWKRHLNDQLTQRRARKENLRKCKFANMKRPVRMHGKV
ncbi:MAG: L-histidine N(alpha)-methyltransferase [wastewater metagenome]|nr:L-histidine N(alpha)-methyltransferase [Candidatus Loosdrechtia aerotolerans]